jgi:uncharacterized protein YcaQ
MRTISQQQARRLAVRAQLLAEPRPTGVLEVAKALGRLQLDPTRAVERSHLLVLWSRLGPFDRAELERLRWEERLLFEYRAFIVPTDELPLYRAAMKSWASDRAARYPDVLAWLKENAALSRYMLAELRRRGPLRLRDFEDRAATSWASTGWTNERNVDRMLEFLAAQGKVTVAGRESGHRLWDLPERCLPATKPLPHAEAARLALERFLRSVGLATERQLRGLPFWQPRPLPPQLARLERDGRIVRVAVEGLPGEWYVHADRLPLLDEPFEPRTTLLSPFDHLIYERARTQLLFGFRFKLEIYVPKEKREFGFFVLPILHGDRLIGRIDPLMDRKTGRLTLNAVHAEPDAPRDAATGRAIAGAVRELAEFLGANEIAYPREVPRGWRSALR